MADEEHGGGGSSLEIVWFLLLLLVGLAVIWIIRGGPKPGDIKSGIFIKPIAPVTGGGGEGYGPTINDDGTLQYPTSTPAQQPNTTMPTNPAAGQQQAPQPTNTPVTNPNVY